MMKLSNLGGHARLRHQFTKTSSVMTALPTGLHYLQLGGQGLTGAIGSSSAAVGVEQGSPDLAAYGGVYGGAGLGGLLGGILAARKAKLGPLLKYRAAKQALRAAKGTPREYRALQRVKELQGPAEGAATSRFGRSVIGQAAGGLTGAVGGAFAGGAAGTLNAGREG